MECSQQTMAPNYQRCPLKPKIFDRGGKIDLDHVKAIETHISADRYCVHPPLKKLVLKGSLNNTTPLLLACAEGDLIVVERIIEQWGVDVNTTATYYHLRNEDSTNSRWHQGIGGATPLFVAAVNGHDPVARYLLGKGANISAKTTGWFYDEMNPLHGALSVITNYDFAQRVSSQLRAKKTAVVLSLLASGADPSALSKSDYPIWMANLCNSDTTATILLINSGMSLKQRNPYDNSTVFHHWAGNPLDPFESRTEEKSPLAVVKLLVEKGADLMALDNYGFSPILIAAQKFQSENSREHLNIFDFLLEQDAIDRREKIDALELMGAVILSDPNNAHLFQIAFGYWRRAMHLRQMNSEPLLKTVMKRKEGLTVEWSTSTELEYATHHPSEYLVQAFLIRLRIYSIKSWKAVEPVVNDFLLNTVPALEEHPKVAARLNILWAILEMIVSLQPIDRRDTWGTTIWTVEEIVKILSNLEKGDPLLRTETIKTSLELILSAEQVHKLNGNHQGYYRTLLKLVSMLSGHPEMLDEENKEIFEKLVQLKRPTPHGRTLLHIACNSGDGTVADFETVCLLIKSGIDPNVGDSDGNGPLYLLFLLYTGKTDEKWYSIARLLIDSGAHLDRVNKEGKTAAEFWSEKRDIFKCNKDRLPDWCYESLPSRLMCLSARIIRSHKIHYTEETLPISIIKFVEMH